MSLADCNRGPAPHGTTPAHKESRQGARAPTSPRFSRQSDRQRETCCSGNRRGALQHRDLRAWLGWFLCSNANLGGAPALDGLSSRVRGRLVASCLTVQSNSQDKRIPRSPRCMRRPPRGPRVPMAGSVARWEGGGGIAGPQLSCDTLLQSGSSVSPRSGAATMPTRIGRLRPTQLRRKLARRQANSEIERRSNSSGRCVGIAQGILRE